MRFIHHASLTAAAFGFAFACGPTSTDCSENKTCPPSGNTGGSHTGGASSGGGGASGSGGVLATGGSGGAGATGGSSGQSGSGGGGGAGGIEAGADVDAAPPCDETSTPDVEGCLVDNRYAVFVAAGSAAGDGTKEAPFGTIGEGVMAAKNRGATRVVVCNATYAEKLSLTQEVAGVNLFGGFTCPSDANGWAYTADERPLVNPTAGTALHVDGVTEAVTLQDIDFKSANATDPGTSSVAAIASGSTVTLKRVAITAGKGANGAKGADGSDVTPTPVTNAEQNGAGASCAMDAPFDAFGGNPPDPSTCGSHGGSGGDGQKIDLPGKPGDPGSPANPAPPEPDENGAGGPGAIGSGNAGDGKAGSRGADGIAGSKAMDSGFDAREN